MTVSSTSEIIQAQAPTVSATINAQQILQLPLTSRSAMDFVTFLPGVTTAGGNRQSQISGLPRGFINITLDGVNIQDNTLRTTDGFFAIVSPRLDAIEEVTLTAAAQGADNAGQGAVSIKFVTRSGSNQFTGSGYEYYRSDKLNANTWFNNRNGVEKAKLKQNQYGVRVGGPIVIPGLFDGRNKAFFFVNMEEQRQPSDTTRERTILKPSAIAGNFRYGPNTVNVLQMARDAGLDASTDPVTIKLLNDILASSATTGSVRDRDGLNLDFFNFNVPVQSLRRYPTVRIDYNVTERHRFSSAMNYNYFTDFPDTLNNRDAQFPGFPISVGQSSERLGWSNTLRSTITQNVVNEARVGYSGAPVLFSTGLNKGMYTGSLANQAGFHINLNDGSRNPAINVGQALTNAGTAPAPQSRNATNLTLEDTLTWLKGAHSLSMGGSWSRYSVWLKNSALVPTLNLGVVTGDPAEAVFTTTTLPGANATQVNNARQLFAILTGRVASLDGDVRLSESTNEYEYMGTSMQRARLQEAGLFVQDAWRVRPTFTLNLGLRYELQFPFYALNDGYTTPTLADLCGISGVSNGSCNLFQPGVLGGKPIPEFQQLTRGTSAYSTDYDNIAPSVGFAWTLQPVSGALRALLSDEFVLRAGYTRAFNRPGMNDFTGQYDDNPGLILAGTPDRSVNNGTLNDGAGLPLLLRQTGRLGAAPFPMAPAYPLTDLVTEDVTMFDPSLKVPYADSWTAGIQRALGRNMALEVRYVGTRSRDSWLTVNYNERNIYENGFLDEFRRAQANLQANVAAGLANQGFRYRGPGTGTVPLPIIYSWLVGPGDPNNPAGYTTDDFATNTTFLNTLVRWNPNPVNFVNGLLNNATFRSRAAAAGVTPNFFVANPAALGGADLTTNRGATNYHSLQLELRRRLSQGLQFMANYSLNNMRAAEHFTLRRPLQMRRDTGDPGDITHVFKADMVYDLPFGRGRRFGGNANGFVHRLIGDWSIGGTARVQTGRLIDLGNVRLVGMTVEDVEGMFRLRFDDAGRKVWMLPQNVIDETIKAFSTSPTTASGYGAQGAPSGRYFAPANGPDCVEIVNNVNNANIGECGTGSLVVTGPLFQVYDVSLSKRVPVVGRTNAEFRVEALNVFNHVNYTPVGGIGNTLSNYEVTNLNGANTSRTVQLVVRFNW